jgi:hypothetical protein
MEWFQIQYNNLIALGKKERVSHREINHILNEVEKNCNKQIITGRFDPTCEECKDKKDRQEWQKWQEKVRSEEDPLESD